MLWFKLWHRLRSFTHGRKSKTAQIIWGAEIDWPTLPRHSGVDPLSLPQILILPGTTDPRR